MPIFLTRIFNSEFVSQDEGCDYPSRERAVEQSITAAMEIAHDIVREGVLSTVVEARLEQNGRIVSRHVVTLSSLVAE